MKQQGGCEAYARDLERYWDGELGAGRRDAVARHLADCPACRAQISAWTAVDDLGRRVFYRTPDPDYFGTIASRVLAAVDRAPAAPWWSRPAAWLETLIPSQLPWPALAGGLGVAIAALVVARWSGLLPLEQHGASADLPGLVAFEPTRPTSPNVTPEPPAGTAAVVPGVTDRVAPRSNAGSGTARDRDNPPPQQPGDLTAMLEELRRAGQRALSEAVRPPVASRDAALPPVVMTDPATPAGTMARETRPEHPVAPLSGQEPAGFASVPGPTALARRTTDALSVRAPASSVAPSQGFSGAPVGSAPEAAAGPEPEASAPSVLTLIEQKNQLLQRLLQETDGLIIELCSKELARVYVMLVETDLSGEFLTEARGFFEQRAPQLRSLLGPSTYREYLRRIEGRAGAQ